MDAGPQSGRASGRAILLLCALLCGGAAASKANILFVLADDLDLTLRSSEYLPRTKALVADAGISFDNWFVHTPICCPSRAEVSTTRPFERRARSRFASGPSLRRS